MSLLVLSFVFLFGACLLKGMKSAIDNLSKARLEELSTKSLQYFPPGRWFFSKTNQEQLSFVLQFALPVLWLSFGVCFFASLLPKEHFPSTKELFTNGLIAIGVLVVFSLLFQLIGISQPTVFFTIASILASPFILLFWPLTLLPYRICKSVSPREKKREPAPFRIKDKILEIFHDAEFSPYITLHDQKLILSVLSLKERIAREVMVPRIDVYALSSDTSLSEAAKRFLQEGYSRIPIFTDSIDNIMGVLYYKDALRAYAEQIQQLSTSIEKLVKPVLYTPETKKISHLLQEFRNKKIHLAIVVDEYGGTEGIVTIEDILEELVGEIADEYDVGEEALFTPLPTGGWIVDAKMTILHIEEELGIKIPQNPEYDTIGGYIFHKAGAIPAKGWRLHYNEFELEVLSSDERSIDKIRIAHHP